MKNLPLILLAVILSLSSCTCKKAKVIPDVSKIQIEDIKIKRYDRALFGLDTNNLGAGFKQINAEYPKFSNFFFNYVLRFPVFKNDTVKQQMEFHGFLSDRYVRKLYDTCQVVFPDLAPLEKDFTQAFKYYKYYLPQGKIPELYSYISGFQYGTPVLDNAVGIGLDFFLGEDYPGYMANENLHHEYIRHTLTPKRVVAATLYAFADDIVGSPQGNRLLDEMICAGKKLYLLDCMLPYEADSTKLGWRQVQVDYVNESEDGLYKLLVDEGLLFATDRRKYRKFVEIGPFSIDSPPDNPGNSGSWLGWQIVKQYMERSPNMSMEKMLAETDAQKFLQKYKSK